MAYVKYAETTDERQIRTLKRWQKRLPSGCRLKTVLGHPYWWVEVPDGQSVANGRTAKKAVVRALATSAVVEIAAAVSETVENDVPKWKLKKRKTRERRERWQGSWQ